ncbi:mycofactocin biosynthesis glycosyltransferase MftF [Modestobacter lapidis]|nr:mycofactocin system glycosyltransferase [Modestobacter lapidis]
MLVSDRPSGKEPARPPAGRLPPGARVVRDGRARLRAGDAFLTGGAPWGVTRLSPPARPFARRLFAVGDQGLLPAEGLERTVAYLLVQRGFAHPIVQPRPVAAVTVIVPAFDRVDLLDACLRSLAGLDVIVVDDASTRADAVRRVADTHRARLIRHSANRGPGAARNTGAAAAGTPFLAFVDSDCTVPPGWLDGLLPHFDDPRVGMVAPRVRPRPSGTSLFARYEEMRSALDMGPDPHLVRDGGPLGYLPSAALVVRRAAVAETGFDAGMRVGEDVDFVWRVSDAGWHARYDPSVEVHHEIRVRPLEWARRRLQYGSSAGPLDRRQPGRLAPVRPSAWNVATVALLLGRWLGAAAGVTTASTVLLHRRLGKVEAPPWLTAVVAGKGVLADALAVGHALRREWWPVGWAAVACARRSPVAASAAVAMLAPIALEHVRSRPAIGPVSYAALRLIEDAAYGTGVLLSAVTARRPGVLCPQVRWPTVRRRW